MGSGNGFLSAGIPVMGFGAREFLFAGGELSWPTCGYEQKTLIGYESYTNRL